MPNQTIQRVASNFNETSSISISKEAVNRLLKELHHYNASNRLRALSEFSHLFANQSDAESWISIIIPEIIEHLLDIEREPRVAVVEIFRVVIQRFKIDALRFIAPVVVSYISSGLSNIHKGVRKQSLILLCIIAEGKKSQQLSGFELIQPFIKNLSDILLSLLNESLKSSFIPTSLVAADSSKKHSTGEGKETVFALLLKTFQVILQKGSILSVSLQSLIVEKHGHEITMFRRETSSVSTNSNGLLLLQKDFCHSSWLKNADQLLSVRSNSSKDDLDNADACNISPRSISQLYEHMGSIWSGVVGDSSLLTMDQMAVLGQVLDITLLLIRGYWMASTTGMVSFICTAFKQFPFICLESSLSAPGSQVELNGKRAASKLNSVICELTFAAPSLTTGVVHYSDSESRALLEKIEICTLYVTNELKELLNRYNLERTNSGSKEESPTLDSLDSEIVNKLFACLTVMLTTESSADSISVLRSFRDFQNHLIDDEKDKSSPKDRNFRKLSSCIHWPMCATICDVILASSQNLFLAERYFSNPEVYSLLFDCVTAMLESSALKQIGKLEFRKSVELLEVSSAAEPSSVPGKHGHSHEQKALSRLLPCVHILLVREGYSVHAQSFTEGSSLGTIIQLFFKPLKGVPQTLCDTILDSDLFRLIDVYYHSTFSSDDELHAVTKVMLHYLADQRCSSEHQSYFLRLFFERRKEFDLEEFINLIFATVEHHCASVADVDSDSGRKRFFTSSTLFTQELTHLLCWSASSDSPEKFEAYILPVLGDLLESIVNDSNSCIEFEDRNKKVAKNNRLFYCYNMCVCLLSMAEALLALNLDCLPLETENTVEVNFLCQLISKACFAVIFNSNLVGSAPNTDSPSDAFSFDSSSLLPVARVLSKYADREYFILSAFLVFFTSRDFDTAVTVAICDTLKFMCESFHEIRSAINAIAFNVRNGKSPALAASWAKLNSVFV